jgi:hypothetical protein
MTRWKSRRERGTTPAALWTAKESRKRCRKALVPQVDKGVDMLSPRKTGTYRGRPRGRPEGRETGTSGGCSGSVVGRAGKPQPSDRRPHTWRGLVIFCPSGPHPFASDTRADSRLSGMRGAVRATIRSPRGPAGACPGARCAPRRLPCGRPARQVSPLQASGDLQVGGIPERINRAIGPPVVGE